MPTALPPPDFTTSRLVTATLDAGARYGRIYDVQYPDPLGFSRKAKSRFSDPRSKKLFGVVYLGQSTKVCFLEAVLRDQRDGVVGPVLIDADFLTRVIATVLIGLRDRHTIPRSDA